MHETICLHCGKVFEIDEAGYADIGIDMPD